MAEGLGCQSWTVQVPGSSPALSATAIAGNIIIWNCFCIFQQGKPGDKDTKEKKEVKKENKEDEESDEEASDEEEDESDEEDEDESEEDESEEEDEDEEDESEEDEITTSLAGKKKVGLILDPCPLVSTGVGVDVTLPSCAQWLLFLGGGRGGGGKVFSSLFWILLLASAKLSTVELR